MPYEHDNKLVEAIHEACHNYELPDIFAALVTVTVDNIHLTEDATFRAKVEAAYIKSLAHVSAVEEQFHGDEVGPKESDAESKDVMFGELLNEIMHRLFVGHKK